MFDRPKPTVGCSANGRRRRNRSYKFMYEEEWANLKSKLIKLGATPRPGFLNTLMILYVLYKQGIPQHHQLFNGFYVKFNYAKLLNNFSKCPQSMSDKSLIYNTLLLDLGCASCKNAYRE